MSKLDQIQTLCLNSGWVPIGKITAKKAIVAMCKGYDANLNIYRDGCSGLAIDYNLTNGKYDYANPSYTPIESWEEWVNLKVMPYNLYIETKLKKVRIPTIIISKTFSKMVMRRQRISKENVAIRDNYKCAYTGKKLSKNQGNIDHIIPVSRNGKNTWDNLVFADKKINTYKGARTPEEAGLKLLIRPYEPKPIPVKIEKPEQNDYNYIEWDAFLN